MKEQLTFKQIRRLIKRRIRHYFGRLMYKISPNYRLGMHNQEILTHIFLKLNAMERTNEFGQSRERLVHDNIDDIETSHFKRYEFAESMIKDGDNVLDIACGVGYGSYIMAENKKAKFTGVDISTDAIEYAKKHYKRDNINFICSSVEDYQPKELFDVIVSFETIEHILDDRTLIHNISNFLKPNGILVSSTPNELSEPHFITKNPFHYRHYTPKEMNDMLKRTGGLKVEAIYTQHREVNHELAEGFLGEYNIHVSRKI